LLWLCLRPPNLFSIYLMLPIKSMICSHVMSNIGKPVNFFKHHTGGLP